MCAFLIFLPTAMENKFGDGKWRMILADYAHFFKACCSPFLGGFMQPLTAAAAPVIGSYIALYFHWQGNFMALLILGLLIIPSTLLYPLSLNIMPEAKGRTSAVLQGGRLIVTAMGGGFKSQVQHPFSHMTC